MQQNYWWISHTQTQKYQVKDGHLWSPKTTSSGSKKRYEAMTYIKKNDIVFSYANQEIAHIGIADGEFYPSKKPASYNDNNWKDDGFKVPVTFYPLRAPLTRNTLNTNFNELIKLLPKKYSPLCIDEEAKTFKGNQGYIFELDKGFARKIIELINEAEINSIVEKHTPYKVRVERSAEKAKKSNPKELLERINSKSKKNKTKKQKGSTDTRPPSVQYDRDQDVKEYVYLRANGKCELCHQEAPFDTADRPYLESHHIVWLSEDPEGDTIDNSVALCPNCHKKMHHNGNKEQLRKDLDTLLELKKYI